MKKSPHRETAGKRPMIVAGIMSGTSADGIDVTLVQIRESASKSDSSPQLQLLAHHAESYPPNLRKAVLAAMNAQSTSTAELARLNWRLGLAYAEAVRITLQRHPAKLDLIGCHGQTLYHQPASQPYAGKRFACTWQLGEPALLAAQLRVPVVSNFRPADMAAGGQGAPLVPLLDYVLFSHQKRGRVLQNIGGIANLTAIPPAATPDQCLAFDSGPGNMVIDALMDQLYHQPFDRNGSTAASGIVLEPVLKKALTYPFFRKQPPRTAGREQFGREYATSFLGQCQALSKRKQDAIATATALTAASIAQSYLRFAHAGMKSAPVDYIISGGGARNLLLVNNLSELLKANCSCRISTSDSFGLPAEAKEAVAFALLAYQTFHHRPGNLPSATGASHPTILGQIAYA